MPVKDKISKSDFSIDNSSSIDVTEKQVEDILQTALVMSFQ
jgi:dephospho-CoA kinase